MAQEGIATGGVATTQIQRQSETGFVWPQEVPWSDLGPEFIEIWGHDKDGKLIGEHIEATGQSGSGKSYALSTILQQRAQRWDTSEVVIVTKEQDDSLPLLGWPVVDSVQELKKYRQVVFWPRTSEQGQQREKYMEQKIYELLTSMWHPDINCVLMFDEIGFVEDLSHRLKKQIRMMWREARSHKLSIIASKQRPIGVTRDQHSETRWKIVFPPADQGDADRFAELLGRRQDWKPVFEALNRERHDFIISNNFLKVAYISWIDQELRPLPSQSPEAQRKDGDKPRGIYGAPPKKGDQQ